MNQEQQRYSMANSNLPKSSNKNTYVPKGKYKKAKHTSGGEFVTTLDKQPYTGYYIEIYGGEYRAGKTPEDKGADLTKIVDNAVKAVTPILGVLAGLAAGLFSRKLTKKETDSGVAKRYFLQNRVNSKIQEVDEPTYIAAKKELPNRVFAEVDWIVKGPAEDKMFGQYKYEGAESKNRKTIQELEKQIPGISTYVTDYKYLVQEPITVDKQALNSEIITERDPAVELENSRKANFDTRK
jgi:hypothetical protein